VPDERFEARRTSGWRVWPVAAAVVILLFGLAERAAAQDAVSYFRQNCVSCHTIGGGRLTGPDLRDVESRQERDYLTRFLMNPQVMLDAGDPYAQAMLEQARGVVMPLPPGITPDMAEALLDLIAAESELEESQFVGLQLSDRPLTPEDIVVGRALFLGTRPLLGGGAACVACHSVNSMTGLGGGRLGPELSKVYERLQGRTALGTWLSAPPTVTMQPVFREHPIAADEILPLVAFFEEAARAGGEDTAQASVGFLLLGLGGTVAGLVAFDLLWRRRFRAVRRPLVHGHHPEGARS